MAELATLHTTDKQSLDDSSVIDHLISAFGTIEPAKPAPSPITVERAEPVQVYDQIRRTLTQHWEYDHRIFLKAD